MMKNHTGCAGELLGENRSLGFWCRLIAICVRGLRRNLRN